MWFRLGVGFCRGLLFPRPEVYCLAQPGHY